MVDIAKAILLRITARTFETQARVFFSAIDEQIGEKGEKVVYYVYFVPISPYCTSISVPELFPQHEARKGDPYPYPERKNKIFVIDRGRLYQA
jgi:hypothetical protein